MFVVAFSGILSDGIVTSGTIRVTFSGNPSEINVVIREVFPT